ncbi:hypothetical protein [Burkholderia cepacia]|uniref:hypothetical protein n=1 Tax=Burkholderia cepacia TaxID=292 RepID=UPI00075D9BAD|nr:hypothetical protein [Burkholderia cepacia]KWH56322.1 hypothetical protein WM00_13830 [Burkholderia cepacia]
MATIKKVIRTIIDLPGSSDAQLAEMLDMSIEDVQLRIAPYIRMGSVVRDRKATDGASPINLYYPSDSLEREFNGAMPAVTKGVQKIPGCLPDDEVLGDFVCGFSTAGCMTVKKGRKMIELSREETARLVRFVDCINIEAIMGEPA